MKKSEFSYKNLYVRPDSASRVQQTQPKSTAIQNKIDRISKEIQIINTRKDLKQFQSVKENDARMVNRYSTEGHDAIRPRKEFKLYTEASEDDPKLREKIERLELELRRRLCDNGFLSFFKTANSSQMSHLDIYLKLTQFQELYNQKQRQTKDFEDKLSECHREIEQLLMQREEAEEKFQQHTKEVRSFTQVIDRLQEKLEKCGSESNRYEQLIAKSEEVEQKYAEVKSLLEQVQKQRVNAVKKNKELEDELEAERRKTSKGSEQLKHKYETEIQTLKSSLSNLTEELNKVNEKCKGLSECNIELRSETESLSSQIEHLTTDLEDQIRKTNEVEDQLDRIRCDSKDIQEYSNQLQTKVDELKGKLQTEVQKKNEYKMLISEHLAKEKKYEEKLSNLRQQVKKIESLTSQLRNSEETILKLKKQNSQMNTEHKKLKQSINTMQKDYVQMEENNKKLEEVVQKLQSDLAKQKQLIEKSQNQSQSNTNKLQAIYDKKQTNQRYRTVGKIKEVCARLKLYIPEGTNIPVGKEADQLDRQISYLASTVGCLISDFIQPLKKQLQNLTINLRTLQLEKQCSEDCKTMEIQARQEALQVLIKFVPEESVKSVQQYLETIEEVSDCRSQTINKKVCLLQAVLKEAQKSKHRQYEEPRTTQTSRRGSDFKDMRRDRSVNRDVVKKYFCDS